MERTVPSTDSEEVELYIRTYYSLLRSSAEVHIRTLEEAHAGMNSLLHPAARQIQPDMSALIYSALRLPREIFQARLVVLGQGPEIFAQNGFEYVENWQTVTAPARRRRYFFDGNETLACFIVSRSDIDDIIPMLTAFQIEWNKMHFALKQYLGKKRLEDFLSQDNGLDQLAAGLNMTPDNLAQFARILGVGWTDELQKIADHACRIRVRLLSGSLLKYRRATSEWWSNVARGNSRLLSQPVYFVSSNTHSLINLLSGTALRYQDRLIQFLQETGDESIKAEWEDIQTQQVPSNKENFFYYLLKKYLETSDGQELRHQRELQEEQCAMVRISGGKSFDVQAQVIELASLNPYMLDPRLREFETLDFLEKSDALILNIDYPLGMGAYHILTQVAQSVSKVFGVYILGKAATLNGVVGDVMIPNVVHDEQSSNTYLFSNCFTAMDVAPFLIYGSVLDNQKAVTVRGTYLQTAQYMDVFYREGYTDIEMEAGPYLSAVYEMHRPKRHPYNEIVNLFGVPFDVGILHYASDKPLSKGQNLGAASLSYYGMDPTYATTIAILRRIFECERDRLKGK